MATTLFRKNENGNLEDCTVQTERVQALILAGWSGSKEEAMLDVPTKEEADTNNTGKLGNKEVRAAARKAGIEDWDKTRISTLKKELGYAD